MEESQDFWKKCNICKNPISFGQKYWVCNVSTCNRKRTGLAFCEVSCWDAHLPFARHRESWAEERRAPSRQEWAKILAGEIESEKQKPKPEPESSSPENPPPEPSNPKKRTAPPAPPAPAKVILRRKG